MFSQNDIVLINFPYSDLTGIKLHPALILSNKDFNKNEDRICCLITSTLNAQGISITQNELSDGKLQLESGISPQRIFTVNKCIIQKRIETLNKVVYNKVIQQVESYLN